MHNETDDEIRARVMEDRRIRRITGTGRSILEQRHWKHGTSLHTRKEAEDARHKEAGTGKYAPPSVRQALRKKK